MFLQKESGNNSEDDQIVVPNVFLIAAYEKSKNVFGGRVIVKVTNEFDLRARIS